MSARIILVLATASLPGALGAQATAIHREPLETTDFPGHGLHTLLIRTTIDRGGVIALHVHPGQEVAYVASGAVEVVIGSVPARRVGAGQSFRVARGTPHSVRNAGAEPAVVVSTYIVDPFEPLAKPVP